MHRNNNDSWHGKRVLITGCCGTVGKELLSQIVNNGPDEVIGVDNNESAIFFQEEQYRSHNNVHFYLGDVRDRDNLTSVMSGIDIVLHSAGLKHVIVCERSPRDPVQTNILGTQNIIDAAIINKVERVLFTSSDKAVNPTNVMGTSKLMGERLMTAADVHRRADRPIFASTRFGNVLGSRGSVIPIFRQQIAQGGPLTLTDPAMTRFIMTLRQAVHLVMDSTFLAHGGEVFVTKMPIVRIVDLAQVMIEELAPHYGYDPMSIEIQEIGTKPGEKLYEELMNEEETRRTVELPRYFAILPALKPVYETINYDYPDMSSLGIDRPYNSAHEDCMTLAELRKFLIDGNLLNDESFPKTTQQAAEGALNESVNNGGGRISGLAHSDGIRR